jgi:beta-lactamase superfamily II metal-dependent hydrolase
MQQTHVHHLYITNSDEDHMSDLEGLWDHGITIGAFSRNRSITRHSLELIKMMGGSLSSDMKRYLHIHDTHIHPVTVSFESNMGGAAVTTFHNNFPEFSSTNDLSLAVFVKLGGFKILFPGDLEVAGWKALLKNYGFLQELMGTTILVASHHGRANGFCSEIFDHFTPSAVVISDKSIVHDTQDIDYRPYVDDAGVFVRSQDRRRHVLTTRRDGDIVFRIKQNGSFDIDTVPTS